MIEYVNAPLEFTAKGIPLSLRPHFQEYILENLDPERNAFTVVERTMARGGLQELRWLVRRFDYEYLRSFVEKYGARLLPRRRAIFWSLYYQVPYNPRPGKTWKH